MEYIIIGAGITGSVIARQLAENGNQVIIYDRRNHIAGNMYDYVDEHDILVQKYGPHIFHTSDNVVIDYVKRFEDWNNFSLVCGASWDGKYTKTPFNFETIDIFFESEKAEIIKRHLLDAYPGLKTVAVIELLKHDDVIIREFAEFLFKNDYAPYTAKQWGMKPSEVDPSVLRRVPVRLSYENGYFSDEFEAMPAHSYTTFVQNIISHKNIKLILNTDALEYISISDGTIIWDGKILDGGIIYTGPLDEFFGCKYGKLPYRSLEFEWRYLETDKYQEAPVVAYPKEKGYTRITEYKQLPPQKKKGTTIAVEFPKSYCSNEQQEPYYPVETQDSRVIYNKYLELASSIEGLWICGRLADFKYYNMDQAISNALSLSRRLCKK